MFATSQTIRQASPAAAQAASIWARRAESARYSTKSRSRSTASSSRTLVRRPSGSSPGTTRTRPKRQFLIFLGAVLEDADASERASVLTAMPVRPG